MALPQSESQKYYDNYALDLQTSPSINPENKYEVFANAFTFEGEYDCNSKIPLMPDCDILHNHRIVLKPYSKTVGRLAQFPTVSLDDSKDTRENN